MTKIARAGKYKLIMVSNQDGLGTRAFPWESFQPVHDFILKSFENEDVHFDAVHIDVTFPADNAPTRKPGTGMFSDYLNNDKYNIAESYVIGDRITDMKLAENLGCKGIWLNSNPDLGAEELSSDTEWITETVALETTEWKAIYEFLDAPYRSIHHSRNTNETKIEIELNLDGSGKSSIQTGLGFFNHMLEQVARHGGLDLDIKCAGDLQIDEHHTIEDTAITLGEAVLKALGDKKGITRYGFLLPMDDCLAQVAIDFGGRGWLVWNGEFKREKIGEMPTEMFYHFFKSFSDAAKCNLNIQASGENEHHKIESIFKAFAKALKMAIKKESGNQTLPSTKGLL
ncbi:MAG: bifunctional histidinol-phosphatase/imidazoleglycerol-phosphate dehydratase HisB [Ginsengibacter sp.]